VIDAPLRRLGEPASRTLHDVVEAQSVAPPALVPQVEPPPILQPPLQAIRRVVVPILFAF